MKLVSQLPARFILSHYFPSPHQNTVLELGLKPINESQWLLVDEDWQQFYQHKQELLSRSPNQTSLALPSSQLAQEEFSDLLIAHLIQNHKDFFSTKNNLLIHNQTQHSWNTEDRSLHRAGQFIQDDICILESCNSEYRLTAAQVCSPSGWKLEDKMERGLDVIHSPVPRYQPELSARVNRLIEKIKPEKPVMRFNWSLQFGNELSVRPDEMNSSSNNSKEKILNNIYWRVERQTLRRLPKTKAVVFSIRIFLHAMNDLAQEKDFLNNLKVILSQLPNDEKAYKSLTAIEEALCSE